MQTLPETGTIAIDGGKPKITETPSVSVSVCVHTRIGLKEIDNVVNKGVDVGLRGTRGEASWEE